MFLEQVLRQYVAEPSTVLDLCDAPGGKSTLLRSVLPEGSLLVSNELIPTRAQVLMENMTKWGHPDVVVTNAAPADFASLPSLFDMIVCDVPCSGEGMFRKDPVAVAEWSEANVETCWRRSRGIVADCWPALKPGGLLVYSTCTFNTQEDEGNVRWICNELGAEILPVATKEEWGITILDDSLPAYRFFPGRTRGEGFFLAVLRKPATQETSPSPRTYNNKGKGKREDGTVPVTCKDWIVHPEAFDWQLDKDVVSAVHREHAAAVALLKKSLHVLSAGVEVAVFKGKDILPTTALALSNVLCPSAFPMVEIDYQSALSFLRGEARPLPADTPRGFVLLTYRHIPLCFAKHLGNRTNNLFPASWRIRTTHLPEKEVTVLE